MPNRDGTGPQGLGPMTGRKLGHCVTEGTAERREVQSVSGKPAEGVTYGVGRGGRPYGGGRGNCFGGGCGRRAMGRGRRFGR